MLLLNGRPLDPMSTKGQAALAEAWRNKTRPVCSCSHATPEMYIANVNGSFIVKRMPSTGPEHAPGCPSWLPPEEVSGLSRLQGKAIEEDEENNTTYLKFAFALSKTGKKRKAPEPGDGEASDAVAPPSKLTLYGTLQYLWYEAGLASWYPKMEGKRWWGVVAKELRGAAASKVVKQDDLSNQLFVPDPFKPDQKEALNAAREEFFHRLKPVAGKSSQKLGILIGELKDIEPSQSGARLSIKHLGKPLFMDIDLYERFEKVFADKRALAAAYPNCQQIVLATVGTAKLGYGVVHELTLMLVNTNWIPFEDIRDLDLVTHLTAHKRAFAKSLRFHEPVSAPIARAILLDTPEPVSLFAKDMTDSPERIEALHKAAEDGHYDHWIWETDGTIPDLPTPGRKHREPAYEA